MTHLPEIEDACDLAQQTVTALIHGDRQLANQLIGDTPHPQVLAFVLADLCGAVHQWWADHAGHPRPFMLQDWVDFLADIETGRATK